MKTPILEMKHIRKTFASTVALCDVDLNVYRALSPIFSVWIRQEKTKCFNARRFSFAPWPTASETQKKHRTALDCGMSLWHDGVADRACVPYQRRETLPKKQREKF